MMFTKAENLKAIEELDRKIRKLKAKGKDTAELEAKMFELLNE